MVFSSLLEEYDGTEDLTTFHLMEPLLDFVNGDRLGHESVQVQPALQIELDEHGKVS